jgi:transposase-like protein
MEANELRRRLAQARSQGRRRYPKDLREAVVAYALRRKAERVCQAKVASELGVSEQTLCYWRAIHRERAGLARVAVVAEQARSEEVILECGPLRVRGLGIEGVAELLKRLS